MADGRGGNGLAIALGKGFGEEGNHTAFSELHVRRQLQKMGCWVKNRIKKVAS
jgi:hypothetical protein